MTRLHPCHLPFTLLICSLSIGGALAQQRAGGTGSDPASLIEAAPRELSDTTIQKRIEDICAQIDTLANVGVSVQDGVVTLSGRVPNEAKGAEGSGLGEPPGRYRDR